MLPAVSLAVAAEHVRHFRPLAGHEMDAQGVSVALSPSATAAAGKSSGLKVAQTWLPAICRYPAVVAR